jgi:hypothetical protein
MSRFFPWRSFVRRKATPQASGLSRRRKFCPTVEALEDRTLLTAGAFLEGTVFLDTNHNGVLDAGEPYQQGATVSLYNQAGTTLLATTTTDAKGAYLFSDSNVPGGLNAGTYRLVETPPAGFFNQGAQALSQLDPATVLGSNTIQVTITDPSNLFLNFNSSTFFGRNAWDFLQETLSSTTDSETAGQFPVTLDAFGAQVAGAGVKNGSAVVTVANTAGLTAGAAVKVTDGLTTLYSTISSVAKNASITLANPWTGSTGNTATVSTLSALTGTYLTFCWDLQDFLKDGSNIFQVTPTPGQGTPPNAGRIAYLYNHYGTVEMTTLSGTNPDTGLPQGTSAQAVGLQVAIWELEYGSNLTNLLVLSKQNIKTAAVVAKELSDITTWANFYVSASAGKSETATFLQVTGGPLKGGLQGMLATGSFNFGNSPMVSPSITTTPGGTVVVGNGAALTDTAVLSGGSNPTGSITFKLYAPDGVTVVDTETVAVSGDATYSTPHGYVPTGNGTLTGTYQWIASYSGDTQNTAVSGRFGDEPEVVSPAGPAITTNPGGTVVLGSGIALTDSATLSGGANPTGSITFTLYAPGGAVVNTETVSVSGNGTYTTPHGYVPTGSGTLTGTYQWVASYSGDANNKAVTGNVGDEPEGVSSASPGITTTPGAAVVVGSRQALTDTATLSGGYRPTGTITFTLYAPDGVTVVDTETVTVTGDGSHSTPNGYVPSGGGTLTGTYQWVASYSGDANNSGATSPLGSEPEAVTPTTPGITTNPGPTVVLGSGQALTDSATLSGDFSPTGTITFTLMAPGGAVVDTEVVTVNGNGVYTTPNGYVPTGSGTLTGTYQWQATYSGDGNNASAISNFGAEPEGVSPASPAITTNPGGTVVVGSGHALTDTATLSGGYNPTGSITFTLYAPDGVTLVDTETVSVSGDGTYTTPNGYVPSGSGTLTGTYQWVASYSGDANNNPAAGKKGDEPEGVSPAGPSIMTVPGGAVILGSGAALTDSATLSGGYNPTGAITFTLYAPDGVTVVDTETVTVTGDGTYSSANGYVPSGSGTLTGTYQWVASYSGDQNNSPAAGNFGDEPETVTAAGPGIITRPGGAVVVGSGQALTDTAVLSGGYSPTGSITFKLYAPDGVTVVDTETVTVTGNGSYTTPHRYVPSGSGTLTGTYQWVASYSGDANNKAAASNIGDEPETVSPAGPAITTTAGGSVVVGSGSALTDSATLSGGYNPAGSITFVLYAPDGVTVVDTETVAVSGNGTYTTPLGYVPTGTGTLTGTYQWVATYSGDGNNQSISGNFGDEPETVNLAGPIIVTVPGGSVILGSGGALTDSATLSGGFQPTGTITFTLYAPGGAVVDSETVTVTGNGTYSTPNGYVPSGSGTLTGTYQWVASYNGDGNNSPATGKKGDEPETVGPAGPAITTTPGGAVVVGSGQALTDTAGLSGGFSATGTITFKLYAPDGVTVVDAETVSVSGNGTYTTPHGYLPSGSGTLTGTYQWVASYSGDSNNSPAASNLGDEPESVVPSPSGPALTTTPGGAVVLGSGTALTDSATLSGGFQPTGTITFKLYAPNGTTVVDTEVATVNGNGTYSTPHGYVPSGSGTLTGTYQWVVSYSGDANNLAVTGRIGDEPETVTPAGPAFTTTPGNAVVLGSGAALTDSATLSGGYNPTGSITFTLYAPGGAVVDTETVTVTGNGTFTTPHGYVPTGTGTLTGTYQWVASYSGDQNNSAAAGKKGDEPETVTPAGPGITTTPGGTILLGSGAALTDTAFLTGGYNPTGTITFTLYAPDGKTVMDTETVTVTGNGTYSTPHGYVPTTLTGTYEWVASYSGDANNQAVASRFGDEAETVTQSPSVQRGDFATIGFWHNKNGQALIISLNGGSSSTSLAKWLATSFPNLYGAGAGVYSMVNKDGTYFTNAQVAASYQKNFFTTGTGAKTNAQVLAAALGMYATSTTLAGGNYAGQYGFNVSAGGTGSDTVNVGTNGAAFGVPNNTTLTVLQLLQATNAQAVNGKLYNGNATLSNEANTVFDQDVNTAGDIQ